MNILQDFLSTEVSYQDMYDEIVKFVVSPHIRCGELEGNRYIVKKMDYYNFIIFAEDVYDAHRREINHVISIYRNTLLKEINTFAQTRGVNIISNIEDTTKMN